LCAYQLPEAGQPPLPTGTQVRATDGTPALTVFSILNLFVAPLTDVTSTTHVSAVPLTV
jgi:hypothetical protein